MEHIVKKFIYKKMFCIFNFLYIINMFNDPSAKCYKKKKKESLQEKAPEKYRNLPDTERYRNLFENERQQLVEYKKSFYKILRSAS